MTVLEEIILHEERGIRLKLFEAPIHTSTQAERVNWIYGGTPFFDKELGELWEMREMDATARGVTLPTYYEQEERRAFMKRPIVLVQDVIRDRIAGWIWIDSVHYKKGCNGELTEPMAIFHIGFGKDYRRFAYPALGYFIERARRNYDSVMSCWGQRSPENDPSNFFRNNGFSVTYKNEEGYAVLRLQKP